MRAGIMVPQGAAGEFDGWEPRAAWERSLSIARHAEILGFDSLWVPDHFHNWVIGRMSDGRPTDGAESMSFESFVTLAALARETRHVLLGQLVLCAGFRNPALTAKMISTLDLVSGGRAVLAIGAGWYEGEWRAYGYDYPPTRERLEGLREQLEVITRMLEPGRATFEGARHRVRDAVNEPKGLQRPRVPIVVGGNGPEVTWRLAARYADELNLDGLEAPGIAEALPIIRQRCEEIGRDPGSLKVSALVYWGDRAGQERIEELQWLGELGLSRVQWLPRRSVESDEVLETYAADCRDARVELLDDAPRGL